jgi:hypothetical protein
MQFQRVKNVDISFQVTRYDLSTCQSVFYQSQSMLTEIRDTRQFIFLKLTTDFNDINEHKNLQIFLHEKKLK